MAKSHSIAQAKYDKEHCKVYTMKMNLVNDSDVIDHLEQQQSKQGYIKDLIRQDIARTRSVPCSPVPTSSVPVSLCKASMEILEEKAAEKGISVPDLIAVMVNEQLLRTCPDTDSVPDLFRDPFTDPITKAVGTWIDKATSVLSDERPYIVSGSVPETEKD